MHQEVKTSEPENSKDERMAAGSPLQEGSQARGRPGAAGGQLLALCAIVWAERRQPRRSRSLGGVHGRLGNLTLLVHSLFISPGERGAGDNDELPDCSQALVFILAALYLDTCPWHCS